MNGQRRNNIASLDANTGALSDWNPNANDWVVSLASNATTVYAGGRFTSIGGQLRNSIAAIDPTTGLATAWNPNADGEVLAISIGASSL